MQKVSLKMINGGQELKDSVDQFGTQLADTETKLLQLGWMDEALSGNRFIAHRGYEKLYPENTLKALYEASRVGLDWEFDPAPTSDNEWVVMHDTTVDRTTNGTGDVSSFTLSQIKALNIDGGNNIALYKGLKVPTLEEVYELASQMNPKPIMFVNTKTFLGTDAVLTTKLADIIKKYNYEKRSILFTTSGSFKGVRNELPNIGICQDFWINTPTEAQLDTLATFAPNIMAGIDYNVLLGASGDSVIQMCREREIMILAHTVNTEANVIALRKKGITTILTDEIIEM